MICRSSQLALSCLSLVAESSIILATAIPASPALCAMPSSAEAKSSPPLPVRAMIGPRASTPPNNRACDSALPAVARATSSSIPVRPFAFNASALKTNPSRSDSSAASDDGLTMADTTCPRPRMARVVGTPCRVRATVAASTSSRLMPVCAAMLAT